MVFYRSLALAIGFLGNIITFTVYLAPVPTIRTVYKKKSMEGFHSLPHVVELLSSKLAIYCAILQQGRSPLISINSVGFVIETLYIALFLFYAPKKSRMQTILQVLLIAFGYGLMVILTLFLAKGQKRIQIVGWICLTVKLIVFAAPLCTMRKVIRTKSVEFMPFSLSLFQTLGAVIWFFYGLLLEDYKLALPNVVGFILGNFQMGLYIAYSNWKEISQNQPTVNPGLNQGVLQSNDSVANA